MATEEVKPQAIDYGFDKTSEVLEGTFESSDIEKLKTEFDTAIASWFEADVKEISDKLTEEEKKKLEEIKGTLTAEIKNANESWEDKKKVIEGETKNLNDATKTQLKNFLEGKIATNPELQALKEKASERDPENQEYAKLEEASINATEAIDTKIAEKNSTIGKIGDYIAKYLLWVPLRDLIKNPNSPYGAILRNFPFLIGLEKEDFKDLDMNTAFNPFIKKFEEKKAELEQESNANILWIETLSEKDKEANAILKTIQKYKVCDGLKMETCDTKKQKISLKAQNWNQVVFLRKFIPHCTTENWLLKSLQIPALNDKTKKILPISEEILSINKSEYKYSEKKDYPDIVSINSRGFDIEIMWNQSQNFVDTIQNGIKAKEEKEQTT